MTQSAPEAGAVKRVATPSNTESAPWPVAFKIQRSAPQGLSAFGVTSNKEITKKRWWSHLLYRGPNGEQVKILYSKTKADSEILAQQFLKEKIVGFDMEWPWDDWRRPNKLQNKIGLIQVATEDKIALFHIGLHTGTTTDDIMAPSLRKLIEDPKIGKAGVAILNADFARLSKYFKVVPKAAVELSHLHRLVTFGEHKPELVSTKMTGLAHQVEQHFGHSLKKGSVRTSDWSKPLSREQIEYAAGDAYAGIMLYHCLNYKRLQMKPTPPLPMHADKYLGHKLNGVKSLYLEPLEDGGKTMTSAFFFGVPTAPQDLPKPKVGSSTVTTINADKQHKATAHQAKNTIVSSLKGTPKALLEELQIRRKAFAAEFKVPESRVALDTVLESLAQDRPLSSEALLEIRGLGTHQEKQYGKGWIEVISSFMTRNGITAPEEAGAVPSKIKHVGRKKASLSKDGRSSRHRVAARHETPESSPAFDTPPPPRTPQLHTGLSFTMSRTTIAPGSSTAEDSDGSLPSLDFGESPSRRTSGQKRKRIESPSKPNAHKSSQMPEHIPRTYRRVVTATEDRLPLPKALEAKTVTTNPPVNQSTTCAPLTPRSKIFRNKLLAFSKLVATKKQIDASQLVSAGTLEIIARNPPNTHEELRRIPGIEGFFHACTDVDMDLLAKIRKFRCGRGPQLIVAQIPSDDKPLNRFGGPSKYVASLATP